MNTIGCVHSGASPSRGQHARLCLAAKRLKPPLAPGNKLGNRFKPGANVPSVRLLAVCFGMQVTPL
jgi:hypothetical protein